MSTPMSSTTPEEIRAEMRKIGGLRGQRKIAPRIQRETVSSKASNCELNAKYKCDTGGNSAECCIVFEGKTSGDKHYCYVKNNKPDWTDFKTPPFNLGEEYNYWVYGQFGTDGSDQPDHGVDGWSSGTDEITNGGREATLFESIGHSQIGPETGAGFFFTIKIGEGRGLFKTKAVNKVPGKFLMSSTCPDGGTTPPDPGGGGGTGPDDKCDTDDDCPPGQICENGECVPGCRVDEDCGQGFICEGNKCVPGCRSDDDCGQGFICEGNKCVRGCRSDDDCEAWEECVDGKCLTPPDCEPHGPAGKWEDCSDDPCKDVDCLPPKECVEGNCVCPEGMVAHGDLCIPDDPCLGVLCQPNATCDEDSGGCLCDEGFIENDKGECVRDPSDPSAECFEEEEDCCSNNPTIQIKAGRGLGGGGSFRLNQSCDKSIQLWVDSGAETAADEECAEDGRSKACSCSYEISQLMDMIADLQSELELIKDNAEQCLTKNDC